MNALSSRCQKASFVCPKRKRGGLSYMKSGNSLLFSGNGTQNKEYEYFAIIILI